jgi:hypothetical protein
VVTSVPQPRKTAQVPVNNSFDLLEGFGHYAHSPSLPLNWPCE